MSSRRRPRVWTVPIVLAALTVTGLLFALLGNGIAGDVGCLLVAVPIGVLLFYIQRAE